MKRNLLNRYTDLVISNGNNTNWSSMLNCQKFAYRTINNFQLDRSDEFYVAGDVAPYVVDGYIHTKRKMATTTRNTLKNFFY